jgi:hypothetical protein
MTAAAGARLRLPGPAQHGRILLLCLAGHINNQTALRKWTLSAHAGASSSLHEGALASQPASQPRCRHASAPMSMLHHSMTDGQDKGCQWPPVVLAVPWLCSMHLTHTELLSAVHIHSTVGCATRNVSCTHLGTHHRLRNTKYTCMMTQVVLQTVQVALLNEMPQL